MNLSIGLSLTRPSGPLGFNPASLFANGEEGAWYDPSDLTTVWQDAAGTTPATVGDPVGRIDDKSGNGNHATQSTATARPTLQVSGGLYYLDFDGVDDWIRTTFSADQAQPNTIATAFKFDISGSHPEFLVDGSGIGRQAFYKSATVLRMFADSTIDDPSAAGVLERVALGHFNGASSLLRMDGVQVVSGNAGSSAWGGVTLGGSSATPPLATYELDGRIYGFIGVNRTLTAGEIDDVEAYLAAKSGVTI